MLSGVTSKYNKAHVFDIIPITFVLTINDIDNEMAKISNFNLFNSSLVLVSIPNH